MPGGGYRVVVAMGFQLRAWCLGVGLGWCLLGWLGTRRVSGCGQGVKSGWDVPGRGRVGFPVAGGGLNWVGVYRVVVALGVRLRAGGRIGSVC